MHLGIRETEAVKKLVFFLFDIVCIRNLLIYDKERTP